MERYLYHTLANVVPPGLMARDFHHPTDYIIDQHGLVFLNATVKPGEYKHYTVIGYAKLSQCDTVTDIIHRQPHLHKWLTEQWPRPVGRYFISTYQVVDVVFTPTINPQWTLKEREEWTRGIYGYTEGWMYDFRSAAMAAIIMSYVNEVPLGERTQVRVIRHLLAAADAINRKDALLYGQWKGPYTDGCHPTTWKRVLDIYMQRYKTGKPVKYAQCWVYAEVLTSAFRFLGYVARTVYATNVQIDRHRDGGIDLGLVVSKGDDGVATERITIDVSSLLTAPTGLIEIEDTPPLTVNCSGGSPLSPTRVLPKGCASPKAIPLHRIPSQSTPDVDVKTLVGDDDGIWNFHVWNEVYIERPDLKAPYNEAAWQCLDASPIVTTDTLDSYQGKYLFGPCSTLNLKDGVNLPHDFRYLYSAVNSVYRYWKCTNDIYYVANISYTHQDRATAVGDIKIPIQPTIVVTRDPERSVATSIVDRDITANYTPTTSQRAYEIHHLQHPLIFVVKHNLLHAAIKRDGSYYVQICCLGVDAKLLSCYRQQVASLTSMGAPAIVPGTCKISTLVVDLATQQWWVQVISV